MFATLLGALPLPIDTAPDVEKAVEVAVRAQEDAGLEPITDGRFRDQTPGAASQAMLARPADDIVDVIVGGWLTTSSMTERAVKQALPGPYSVWHRAPRDHGRARGILELAGVVREVVAGLAEAGCPLVEIEETAIDRLGDEGERELFRDAHERLLDGLTGTHLTLSIAGGSPDPSAWTTLLGLPYASLAIDLIAGPDNWNLATRWPGDRGVIAGVESAARFDEPKELLLWAAHYAASTGGRGVERVGLGSAGSWANLTWDAAVRKMRVLGEAARLASMPPGEELARSLDPRAVDARRAALGHAAGPPPRRRRGI